MMTYPRTTVSYAIPKRRSRVIDSIAYDDLASDNRSYYLIFKQENVGGQQTCEKTLRSRQIPFERTQEIDQIRWVARFASKAEARAEQQLVQIVNANAERFWRYEFIAAPTPKEAIALVKGKYPDALQIEVTEGGASDMLDYSAGRNPFNSCEDAA
jgi:hypothetical protein